MPPLTAHNYHKYVVNAPDHQNIHELIFPIFNNNNIEHASPFYDEDLINTCLNISPYLKLKNGYERFYFRENMKGIVPEEIRLRQEKANFKNNFESESENFTNNMHHFLKEIIHFDTLEEYMIALKSKDDEIYKKSNEISSLYMIKIFDMWLKSSKDIQF
jgi:asparagine synthetase B (glutamine-hydrolysing)